MEENTMRYNSSRNRITRSLGVLVGAALVAALVLPSVAQAQPPTPVAPSVTYLDSDDLRVSTTYDDGESDDTVHNYLFWTMVNPDGETSRRATVYTMKMVTMDLRGSSDHGTWEAKVQSAIALIDNVGRTTAGAVRVYDGTGTAAPEPPMWVKLPTASGMKSSASPARIYTHGPPSAPENFGYNVTSAGAHLFSWSNAAGDYGISGYRLEWTKDDPSLANAKWERAKAGDDIAVGKTATNASYALSSTDLKKVDEGVEYTFRLVALGLNSSDNADIGNDNKVEGAGSDLTLMLGEEATTGTTPTPTPTLPEWAALFLAMLLMGSGAYLLRGRQQGGLTL